MVIVVGVRYFAENCGRRYARCCGCCWGLWKRVEATRSWIGACAEDMMEDMPVVECRSSIVDMARCSADVMSMMWQGR